MPNPALTLFHFPGACSQVALFALEHAKLDYRLELVNIAASAQTTSEYLALSPLGKVPLLRVDGFPLSENAAILTYIAALAPQAGLFPSHPTPLEGAEAVGGMSFCGGTLHPIVRGIANPVRVTTGDGEGVRERSTELAKKSFGYADRRLGERGWWLGEWSIVDVYLQWVFGVARNAGFGEDGYANLAGLEERLAAYPAFGSMRELNARGRASLGL